jgi:succinate dehydrogenase / fumarate reductase iron-sulfur subunit
MKIDLIVGAKENSRRFRFDMVPESTLLDALETLRADLEADSSSRETILYRHSCHHGSCGTCGALVNGRPRLLCLTRLAELGEGEHRVEPLQTMTWIGDIAVYPGSFFESIPDTDYLIREKGTGASRMEDCIECGLCVAACPVTKAFKGPAALAAAAREISKHEENKARFLAYAEEPDGARSCERAFECSRVCPRQVSPGKKITELLSLIS